MKNLIGFDTLLRIFLVTNNTASLQVMSIRIFKKFARYKIVKLSFNDWKTVLNIPI